MRHPDYRILATILGLTVFLLHACSKPPDRTRFATPADAAKALSKALKTDSAEELKAIFGPNAEKDLTSGDPISDRNDRQVIALAMEQSWRWDQLGSDRMELVIGHEQWPLPIPLVKVRGGWQFDTEAGKDEMLSRRIGRNELRATRCKTPGCLFQGDHHEFFRQDPR